MAQRGGRIVCPRCGSNNFDTVTACWKCSAPLAGGVAAQGYTPSPMSAAPAAAGVTAAGRAEGLVYGAATAAHQMGDSARANRAAFWLGMLFPYFGFPIGLAFMMCDDRRRQEVGRICILWSTLSGAIHLLLMFVSLLGLRELLVSVLGIAKSGAMRGMPSGGGLGGGLGGGDGT